MVEEKEIRVVEPWRLAPEDSRQALCRGAGREGRVEEAHQQVPRAKRRLGRG